MVLNLRDIPTTTNLLHRDFPTLFLISRKNPISILIGQTIFVMLLQLFGHSSRKKLENHNDIWYDFQLYFGFCFLRILQEMLAKNVPLQPDV